MIQQFLFILIIIILSNFNLISIYSECSFGMMFWYYEMYINLQYLQTNNVLMEECHHNASKEMKKFNIPSDHIFHGKL